MPSSLDAALDAPADVFDRAVALASAGQYADAATAFGQIERGQPQYASARAYLGALAGARQDWSAALAAFVDALVADPARADVRGNLATLVQHRPSRARAGLMARALGLHPVGSGERAAARVLDELTGACLPSGPRKPRLLFVEQEGLSTARFLDPIAAHFEQHFDVVYLKTTDVNAARTAIERADVVWLEWAGELTALLTEHAPALRRTPTICRLHGFEVFTDFPARIRWEAVDRLVFVADHKRELFAQRFPQAAVETVVVRNGVDLSRFSVAPGKANTKHAVLLGHLNYRKGLPLLLQFFHALRKRDPAFRLTIRGGWQDERYRMYVLHMIGELGLADAVTFAEGWIDDLDAWLADKSHVLSFSLEESFHYAVGEGMAAGLRPVVHAWKEARAIWPEEHVFADLDGFLDRMLDPTFTPDRYRAQLAAHDLTEADQMRAFSGLLGSLV